MVTANQPSKVTMTAGLVSNLVVLVLLGATLTATVLIWTLGDWQTYGWALTLTLRILWGCWFVACLATVLTQVTIFGWSFRQYFRWPEAATAKSEKIPVPPTVRRPTRAPWTKSGKASFGLAVALVSVTGAIGLATVIMWVLMDVTGPDVFWLVFKILWSVWWVVAIILVLVRVAIFDIHKKQALARQQQQQQQQQQLQETAASAAENPAS